MTPFLYQVARHYLAEGISDKCLVFPNRRSIVFFTKHLRTLVAAGGGKPVIMPRMLTVADFFGQLYGAPVADKVSLILELYDVYRKLYPRAESLDDFIFWGDVILSDFSDTDKYLVDPKQLFTNVADLKAIEDTYEYLSPEQRTAVEQFLRHFKNEISPHGRNDNVVISSEAEGSPSVKERFMGLWNILLPLYEGFREALAAKGLAYDGMVYRSVADAFKDGSAADIMAGKFPGTGRFVFIGLNALNECERLVLKRLRDCGLASFCWDYCGSMIKDKANRSSFFMDKNIADYPMDWALEDVTEVPQVNVIAVPSAVGQAKLLPTLVRDPEDTAVVLPEESMLLPVLNSIPDTVRDVNVTMGMPLTGSQTHALMHDITLLQLHLRKSGDEWYFYHKYVWNILSGGIFKKLLTEQDVQEMSRLKAAAKFYIPQSDFSAFSDFVQAVFTPVVKDAKAASAKNIKEFESYLEGVVRTVAPMMLEVPDLAAELEFAKRWLDSVLRLKPKTLEIQPATYVRLLGQILSIQAVPLEGEPLGGLQIMGPLETRALDFGTVILLSCNDGVFPRHSVSPSFVPPQLRKAFGLPTYEFQDSIWAYYFYRMICRAGTVWLLYDTRTEGVVSGEESRYIKQLRYHFRLPIKTYTTTSGVSIHDYEPPTDKPADIEQILKSKHLSASSLQNYLKCQAMFYYASVLHLKPEDEVSESLDAGMFGDVYHSTMEALYLRAGQWLTVPFLDGLLKDKAAIRGIIGETIKRRINTVEVTGRNLVHEDIIFEYVIKTLELDRELVEKNGEIEILGLEKEEYWNWNGFRFYGKIDRLERFRDGTIRVVDYKTGGVKDEDISITDDNAQEVIDNLFGDDSSKRPKIAFQLFLYDMYVQKYLRQGEGLINSIYPAQKLFTKGIVEAPVSNAFCSLMKNRLTSMLADITDLSKPFTRTEDRARTCIYCDFKNICGR